MPRSANSGKNAHDEFKVGMSLKPLSPHGDLSVRDDESEQKMTRKQFKNKGGSDKPSKYLPRRTESMVIDSKYGPGDTV